MRKKYKQLRIWLCNKLGWHRPEPASIIHLGFGNFKAFCKYCGREINSNSQGRWF